MNFGFIKSMAFVNDNLPKFTSFIDFVGRVKEC